MNPGDQRRLAGVWSLPGMTLGGGVLGAGLDRWLGTTPWITIGLAGAGFAAAVAQLLRAPPGGDGGASRGR